MRPLVVGRYPRPSSFKGVVSPPCDYMHNSEAWMSRELFAKWIMGFDDEMVRMKRQILLLLDDCASHLVNIDLSNIRVEFLPPSCALIMPLSLGIIKNVKVNYRQRLVHHVLVSLDCKDQT